MALIFTDIINYQLGGNLGKDYLLALGSFIIFIIALLIVKGIIIHRLKVLVKKTKNEFY